MPYIFFFDDQGLPSAGLADSTFKIYPIITTAPWLSPYLNCDSGHLTHVQLLSFSPSSPFSIRPEQSLQAEVKQYHWFTVKSSGISISQKNIKVLTGSYTIWLSLLPATGQYRDPLASFPTLFFLGCPELVPSPALDICLDPSVMIAVQVTSPPILPTSLFLHSISFANWHTFLHIFLLSGSPVRMQAHDSNNHRYSVMLMQLVTSNTHHSSLKAWLREEK